MLKLKKEEIKINFFKMSKYDKVDKEIFQKIQNLPEEEKKKLKGRLRSLANLKPFQKGKSGWPQGRPRGRKDFQTYFIEAWREVAEALNLNQDPDKAKIEIIKLGFKRMFKGDYQFWRDFMDRLFGKAPEQVEVIQKQLLIDLTEPTIQKIKENQKNVEND